jgi:hypothetical protein
MKYKVITRKVSGIELGNNFYAYGTESVLGTLSTFLHGGSFDMLTMGYGDAKYIVQSLHEEKLLKVTNPLDDADSFVYVPVDKEQIQQMYDVLCRYRTAIISEDELEV